MSETVSVPLHKVEVGDSFWMDRDDTGRLSAWAFYFQVMKYDSDFCKVEITGHADDEDGGSDE